MSDKAKLKEENLRLRRINQEQEEEIKNLRDAIDRKNRELSANFEEISTLKQELAHFKIDYLYSNLGEKKNQNLNQESSNVEKTASDEIARIEYI